MTPRRAQSETRWRGIAAAPGVAVGHAYVYRVAHHEPPLRKLGPRDDPEAEFQRLEDALAEVRADLERMQHSSKGFVGSAMDKIFDAQLLIIADETLRTDSRALITDKRLNAESAFWRVVTESQDAIRRSSDPFLREMANEIQTVKRRVLNRLLGLPDMPKVELNKPAILLAHTITPADIMSLRRDRILGIVSETGGQTSHTALLAKSMGIPAVAGVAHDVRIVPPGTLLVVDGYSGSVIVDPDSGTVAFMERKKKRSHTPWSRKLDALRELPAETTDGHRIDLMANIDIEGEVERVREAGADGVGLYRTEYLYLQRGGYPSEARQRAVYRRMVAGLDGRTLTVRTFDLGADKVAPDSPLEENPALGVRGLRLSLNRPRTLLAQMRALLAASDDGPIRVMVPMVSAVEEFDEALRIWRRAQDELAGKGIPFDANTDIGLMIETPAAVCMAPELAKDADFFSIGTNDLIQYTAAADRGNTHLIHLANPWQPSLWRQIDTTVAAAHAGRIPVTLCGEMASEPLAVPALIGFGLDAISVHPNSAPKIKSLIRAISQADCRDLAEQIREMKTAAAIQEMLRGFCSAVNA